MSMVFPVPLHDEKRQRGSPGDHDQSRQGFDSGQKTQVSRGRQISIACGRIGGRRKIKQIVQVRVFHTRNGTVLIGGNHVRVSDLKKSDLNDVGQNHKKDQQADPVKAELFGLEQQTPQNLQHQSVKHDAQGHQYG